MCACVYTCAAKAVCVQVERNSNEGTGVFLIEHLVLSGNFCPLLHLQLTATLGGE